MISSLSHISAHAKRMLQCHPIAVRACFGYKLGGNTPPPPNSTYQLSKGMGRGERVCMQYMYCMFIPPFLSRAQDSHAGFLPNLSLSTGL